MSKRRTRKEKERAASHRPLASIVPFTAPAATNAVISIPSPANTPTIAQNNPLTLHNTHPSVEYLAIKKDLLQTLLVIVLALALELGVYYFKYSVR